MQEGDGACETRSRFQILNFEVQGDEKGNKGRESNL